MATVTDIDAPVELVPEKLYRLGGTVPMDGRLSWVPASWQGEDSPLHESLNSYLLIEGDRAMLVDSGVTVHRDAIVAQIAGLLGDRNLEVFLTRFEPDCLVNLPHLVKRFGVTEVHGGGVSNPFDFFDDLSTSEQLRADAGVQLHRRLPGDAVKVGEGRELNLVATTIRLLTTFWAYDTGTKTLFSSDAFGHVAVQGAAGLPYVDGSNDPTTFENVRDHLFTKFDWLLGAETAPLRQDLAKVFSTYDVHRIAPTHGGMIVGKDTVAKHIAWVDKALSEVEVPLD
jgi:flavorubredoxin